MITYIDMANIRSLEQIISGMLDYYKLRQPDADTKPGTVIRDLFIEAPATQLAILYDELAGIGNKQSILLANGSDLDKLARNYGLSRRSSTPSTGVGLLTFPNINAPISIGSSSYATANNGMSFYVSGNTLLSPENSNTYKSLASKYREQLNFVGITDQYAVEVSLTATSSGAVGNIGKYTLSSISTSGISNITNVNGFGGGTDVEGDASFRNRILGSFNGASVGTALGYANAASSTTGVSSVRVIEPGNVLMTRDGSVVKSIGGNKTIIAEGSGGKVDIIILGSILVENSESFIFKNKSNDSDIANVKNDLVLGQIFGDEKKTINKKRSDNLASGTLPSQPVENIIQVSGSISGSNFVSKSVDSYGRVSGNYELIKDDGAFAGSPWALDRIHWIKDNAEYQEDKIKGQAFGQDKPAFTDIIEIPKIQQNISIVGENSIITTDRSIIQLLHTPATNITKVFNVNTGEIYVVIDNNYDKTPNFNSTGRIKISGNTLPSNSDILQVDYGWIVEYDQYSDYDGLSLTDNQRNSVDSIDWGYSSEVKGERVEFTKDVSGNYYAGTTLLPINSVISVNNVYRASGTVQKILSGIYANSLYVDVGSLITPATAINSIKLKTSNVEVFETSQNTGSFSNSAQVVGSNVFYNAQIILPTDSFAKVGDKVDVLLNSTDVFKVNNVSGSSNGNIITIPSSSIDTTNSKIDMNVSYIAAVSELFSSGINALPASKNANGYLLNNNVFDVTNITNVVSKENLIVQKNLSNQFYVELSVSATEYSLKSEDVVSVVKISDGKSYWDPTVSGTLSVGVSGNHQIILDGYNSPLIGDRVMTTYTPQTSKKYQPFSFQNKVLNTRIVQLDFDSSLNEYFIPYSSFVSILGLKFDIYDENNKQVLLTINDGYLISSGSSANVFSASNDFSSVPSILSKKLIINSSANASNNGVYDISSYDVVNKKLTINGSVNIGNGNISAIRLLDGKEIWNMSTGIIDSANERLLIGKPSTMAAGDLIQISTTQFKNLNQTPTRLMVSVTDQVINTGVISIVGTTLYKAADIIFTSTSSGLKVNFAEAIKKDLKLSSSAIVPLGAKLVKIIKVEKVNTVSITNSEVMSVVSTYDGRYSQIKNNELYSDSMILNESLSNTEGILSNSGLSSPLTVGDKIRATFYYTISNDIESLYFTRNNTLFTNKKFATINKIYVSSGFKASQSAKITINSFTQPALGSRYKAIYNYVAPKINERIVVNYNFNKLITNTTFNIENTRPINADVIVKSSVKVPVDLTMNIVVNKDYKLSSSNIVKNLKDRLISVLTTTDLGDILDLNSLITVAEGIPGIDRARVLIFNRSGSQGKVSELQAEENEYFISNTIIVNTESR